MQASGLGPQTSEDHPEGGGSEARGPRPEAEDVNPLVLCQAIDRALAPKSIVVADGGDFVSTASYIVRPRAPLSWLDPGPFGTLGVGGGFAIGAAVSRPGEELWILYGDGALGFSLAEFDTFARHRIPVIAVVANDGCWSQIHREQVDVLGDDTVHACADRLSHRRHRSRRMRSAAAGRGFDRGHSAGGEANRSKRPSGAHQCLDRQVGVSEGLDLDVRQSARQSQRRGES